jgi:site-specific DNA-methyltransferase (adenine-specific)
MKGQDVLFSKDIQTYSTPQELFDWVDSVFHFTVDVCADKSNHKCSKYYNDEMNGLLQSWSNEVVWCNPPYSESKLWVLQGINEIKNNDCETAVYLIPARVGTKLWHEIIAPETSKIIIFLKGRLKFSGNKDSAPFPSALVIFGQWIDKNTTKIEFLDYRVVELKNYLGKK